MVKLIELPTRLFTCETLEVLTLQGSITVRMPALGSLPRLKKLELTDIDYQNDESARMLIASCQSLETLVIRRQLDDGVKNFIITSSTLKYLTIEQSYCYECDFYKHVINAPSLQHIELIDGPPNGFVVEDLSSLVKTKISLSPFSDDADKVDDNFYNLLRGICNSENLEISTGYLESAIAGFAARIPMFPKFDRLSALKVSASCCNWGWLQEFIKNSDRLDALEFRKVSCHKKKHVVCWRWNPKTVPICLLSSLKTMEFFGFDGLKDELRMVEYILKNAKVMQKMKIQFSNLRETEPETEPLRRKILKFPKGSEECEVNVY